MASSGWIKAHRSITDHWIWDCEFSYGQAWMDLLLKSNHTENKIMIKSQMVVIKRGQQARSEVTLSKSWKWSRNKVRRFLKNLEDDGMIKQETTHLTSIITICNYDSFQGGDTSNETTEGHLTEQQKDIRRNTNKNDKKERMEEVKDHVVAERQPKPTFDFDKVKSVWNEVCGESQIKTTKCNIVSEKAKRQLPKTYSKYCKVKKESGHEPAERHRWCRDYFKAVIDRASGFAGQEGEHSNWKPNLEYATRVNTYDQVMEWIYDKRA